MEANSTELWLPNELLAMVLTEVVFGSNRGPWCELLTIYFPQIICWSQSLYSNNLLADCMSPNIWQFVTHMYFHYWCFNYNYDLTDLKEGKPYHTYFEKGFLIQFRWHLWYGTRFLVVSLSTCTVIADFSGETCATWRSSMRQHEHNGLGVPGRMKRMTTTLKKTMINREILPVANISSTGSDSTYPYLSNFFFGTRSTSELSGTNWLV